MCTYFTGTVDWEPLIAGAEAIALLNVRQRSRGAVMVAPRRHLLRVSDLDAVEIHEIGELIRRVATAVTRAFDPEGLHIWCGGGVLAGQSEPHVHFQVVPRYDGVSYSFATSHMLRRANREECREVARQIRAELREQLADSSAS